MANRCASSCILVTNLKPSESLCFYWYKANWASSDTLHITSKRYIDRTAESISVKVYSNKSSVSLYVNGVLLETKDSTNKIFVFDNVPLCEGSNKVEAIADNGAISDVAYFNKVSQPNASYIFDAKQDNYFLDWFQELGLEVREDKYSVNDTVGQIMANANTKEILVAQISQLPNGQHLVKYLQSEEMFNLVKNVRVRVLSVHQPDVFSEEFLLQLNVELSKISK